MSLDFFHPSSFYQQQTSNNNKKLIRAESEENNPNKSVELTIRRALKQIEGTEKREGRRGNCWERGSPDRKGTAAETQPYISGSGGAKRKLTEFQNSMHQARAPNYGDGNDEFASTSSLEPKAKRRYEERMSTKLGGMNLRDETNIGGLMVGEEERQRKKKGPLIEEITDWDDEELLEGDEIDEMLKEAAEAPIIEEPEQSNDAKKDDGPVTWEEWHQNKGTEGEEQQQQRIMIDPKLRELIMAANNNAGSHFPFTGRSLRTGKELIPYVPSIRMMKNGGTDEEEGQNGGVEEILDEEVLADTADSPQVQSDNDESWPPTPLPADATVSDDDEPEMVQEQTHQQDEEAMELD